MSVPSSPPLLSSSTVISRLREAGCVFAEDEARLILSTARTPAETAAMVERRAAGVPLEHVLGWAEFCGLRVAVEPGVFVPRRRTEFLVAEAVALLREARPVPRRAVVVDLCCGSGAVTAALRAAVEAAVAEAAAVEAAMGPGPVEWHAADIEPAAVRCARRNLGSGAAVYEGDLYDPLPARLRGRVDVLVANAPYVPTDAFGLLPAEARLHEPRVALDGGADGLDVQRRVTADAVSWLAPGGRLLVETSERQAAGTVASFRRDGLSTRVARCADLSATVVIGSRPDARSGRVRGIRPLRGAE
ncbi:putative protein N(5)-glutamine methyltransferase [Streptomyces sp. NPDC047108]|uniref:putative protein N(5)-glutamine methyltransferase n=1 Tax=Streptomyces sp. NPDC047108 TaxID=3155025 RepID=UPI0033C85BD2